MRTPLLRVLGERQACDWDSYVLIPTTHHEAPLSGLGLNRAFYTWDGIGWDWFLHNYNVRQYMKDSSCTE